MQRQALLILVLAGSTFWNHSMAAILVDAVLGTEATPIDGALNSALDDIATNLNSVQPSDPNYQNSQTLLGTINAINSNPADGAGALKILGGKSNSAGSSAVKKTPNFSHLQSFTQKFSLLRRDTFSFSRKRSYFGAQGTWRIPGLSGVLNADPNEAGGLFDNRWSGYFNGDLIYPEQDETASETGFDGNFLRFTGGFDFRFATQGFVGFYVSYVDGAMDLDNNAGEFESSETRLGAYATYYIAQNLYVDTSLSVGARNFDITRKVSYQSGTVNFDQTATSDPSGRGYEFNIGAGWEYEVLRGGYLGVTTSLVYSANTIEAFSESGASGYNLSFDEQEIGNLTYSLGGRYTHTLSTRAGVFTPYLGARWIHEFDDAGDSITAHFSVDPQKTPFSYKVKNADSDYMDLSLGFSAVFAHGVSGFAQWETVFFFDDYTRHGFSLGVRKEF